MTRLVGPALALRLILGAEIVDGAHAQRLGLVQWNAPLAELPERAASIAARYAAMQKSALAANKRCIAAAMSPQQDGYAVELRETRALYDDQSARLSPHLQALAAFGRHEIACLTEPVSAERLAQVRGDRDACLRQVPAPYQSTVAQAWSALEGLCLARMGRAREAVALLEYGLESLGYNPARVVYLFHLGQAYEQLGERRLAAVRYEQAMQAFPGTRLASEARARCLALGSGGREELFRGMLPESPTPALAVPHPEQRR